jgi:hypothetical protein
VRPQPLPEDRDYAARTKPRLGDQYAFFLVNFTGSVIQIT